MYEVLVSNFVLDKALVGRFFHGLLSFKIPPGINDDSVFLSNPFTTRLPNPNHTVQRASHPSQKL